MQTDLLTNDLAEIKVTYSSNVKASNRKKVTSSKEAVDIFRNIWTPGTLEHHESFYILLLNRANAVLGYYKVSEGGMTGTVADPRLIFSVALKCAACSVILAHNHPSGNNQPSANDLALTKNIAEGGKVLEINVLDHVILTAESFYSFADEGLI